MSEREPSTGIPRWVIIFGIVAVVLVLLVVINMLLSGGHTSPIQHGVPQP
ncbi:MAG: hypothetical protein HY673_17460 [Chloroflexi bacterium]|nr:hypothetical protein [Chloroflexota bacterium]